MEMTEKEAAFFAEKYYDIIGTVKKLPGEVDYNFYLKNKEGKEFTLKISRPETSSGSLGFQTEIIQYLRATNIPLQLPEIIFSSQGKKYVELNNGQFLRLQKWVPGRMLANVNPRTPALLQNWGKTAGLLSKHLHGFDHPVARREYKWDPARVLAAKKYRSFILEKERLEIADYFWDLFEKEVTPVLPALRKSVNYNDAHEHNLLVDDSPGSPVITGVIDFGDALWTQTVNELAIAIAYAAMYMPDPLRAASEVVRGYHKIYPLQEAELAVLFPLVAARLLLTVTHSAWNKHHEPHNEYLLVSEQPAWDLLKKMRVISPALAHYSFRRAAGYSPCPKNNLFESWAEKMVREKKMTELIPLKKSDGSPCRMTVLDLSVGSLDLGNNSNFDNIKGFEKKINQLLAENNADYGVGGYGEVRPFYSTDAYKVEGNMGAQWRTVHLGLDVWGDAGTAIFSPLAGKIFSVKNNAGERDYGPTLIVEHEMDNGQVFYLLYGHLSLESLEGKEKGMAVEKGEKIAEIGAAPVNGNWPPHLHFQVMLDMLGMEGDFPGVCFPTEAPTWLSICPDPGLFLPGQTSNSPEKPMEEILAVRRQHLGGSLSISYQEPLHIVRGYRQYLYDRSARRYLDTVNNVPHVGHQHPRVVRAAQRQMAVLNTNTRYLHENIVAFAEELLATFPPELSVVHFVNSGSEANELALRMVEACTGQKDMIAVEVGYHGNTRGTVGISSYKFDGRGGKGAPSNTHIVPIPDTFRGLYKDDKTAGKQYAAHVGAVIEKIKARGRGIGGFICESILSCGGQIVLPDQYLPEVYRQVRSEGGLCIADEVQVGFGRAGEKFWGFELQGVVPDIVTMGKPIGNGHPLAAVVCTRKVADAFANGMEYFNTFGGNPVSCAIGREVLQIVKEENLQQHALMIGNYLKKGLNELKEKYPIIGDVRGHGLFLGFELVKDPETLEPAAEQATYLANRMRERAILMSTDGPFHNVMKIKPPMCFDQSNADFLLSNLEKVLREDFLKLI